MAVECLGDEGLEAAEDFGGVAVLDDHGRFVAEALGAVGAVGFGLAEVFNQEGEFLGFHWVLGVGEAVVELADGFLFYLGLEDGEVLLFGCDAGAHLWGFLFADLGVAVGVSFAVSFEGARVAAGVFGGLGEGLAGDFGSGEGP